MLDNWQRIEQVIKWGGYASVSAFAREIGLNRSENLYQIKRGNNGISRDLSETITNRFPELSRAWLLTGEGEMLRSDKAPSRTAIPFFKADAVHVAEMVTEMGDEMPAPDYYVSFPVFDGCTYAAITMSDSMSPEVPRGAILFFAPAQADAVVPGEMYLVVSPRFSGIRYLRRSPHSDEIRLVPANRKGFDEVVVSEGEIEKLYMVRGVVTGKGI